MTPRAGRPLAVRALAAVALAIAAAAPAAAQPTPPVPRDYVTDGARILSADARRRLEERLRAFEAETSNQVLVATFTSLPSASLEDFTVRTAQAWRAGRGKVDNGIVLFVFVENRRVRIEVGYGLEGALPDITANRILEEQITPRFRAGDYDGGVEAGVNAIVAATKGEYKAEPRPASGGSGAQSGGNGMLILFIIIVLIVMMRGGGGGRGGRTYGRRGYRGGGFIPIPMGWGGGGWGGGGGGGFGGGFSGGGGSFGGGGASGSW